MSADGVDHVCEPRRWRHPTGPDTFEPICWTCGEPLIVQVGQGPGLGNPEASSMTAPARFFVAPNAWDEPSIWRVVPGKNPAHCLNKSATDPDLWNLIVAAIRAPARSR